MGPHFGGGGFDPNFGRSKIRTEPDERRTGERAGEVIDPPPLMWGIIWAL